MSLEKLKWAAIISFVLSLLILLGGGYFARDRVPPYPGKVVDSGGNVLFQKSDIMEGQNVYQRYGLMDHGSVWGHGSQRGMEFSATTLHLLGDAVRTSISNHEYGKAYSSLDDLEKGIVDLRTTRELKTNRYDAGKDTLTLTPDQVAALESLQQFWEKTFKEGQKRYGFLPDTIQTPEERLQIARFFFWTAWVASANRPGEDYSYTNNWPADRSVGNVPPTAVYFWTLGGIFALFVVLGIFIFFVHHYGIWYGAAKGVPLSEKMIEMPLTPSQFTAAKYFLVVILLFLVQTSFGGLLAHYTINPGSFYFPIVAAIIPYSWAKSWHLQLAIFWIATTWIGSAIYLAPIIGGVEPRRQSLLVRLLFGAILVVAGGSLLGEIAGIKGLLGEWWFWIGHQGWEFLELGKLWQILLFVGLIAWLLIVYRPLRHLLKEGAKGEFRSLVVFYLLSAILVVGFLRFRAPLWQRNASHRGRLLEMVRGPHLGGKHLRIFRDSGHLSSPGQHGIGRRPEAALMVAYFTATIVFFSGILGTAHHYFWFGGPSFWLALGGVFSSLEPVPLFGLVVRGILEYRSIRKEGKEFPYKWPLYFLVASSFWNFLGAGVFGFLINLPIVNYYEHGTYLTMNHAHGALFGVYGMLSIGLLLFSWRGMVQKAHWNDRLLKVSFFGLNIGLFLLTLGTLFPVGALQAWTSYKEGLWVARDAAFFERPAVLFLGTVRIIPDLLIIIPGVLTLAYFLFKTYPYLKAREIKEGESVWDRLGIKL